MPVNVQRKHRVGVRLSDEENWYCEELERRHGTDASGVMRKYMLKGAREEGLVYPGPPETKPAAKKKAAPKH